MYPAGITMKNRDAKGWAPSHRPHRTGGRRVAPAKENQDPDEDLSKLSGKVRLTVGRLRGAGGFPPRWVNLDGEINSLEAIKALARAFKGQKPKCSVETLSLRYCRMDADALKVLVGLVTGNRSLETMYLHLTVMKHDKAAWNKVGYYHRVKNAGQSLFRKVSDAYLKNREKHVPAWALKPPAKEKGGKKKKKGKKKK